MAYFWMTPSRAEPRLPSFEEPRDILAETLAAYTAKGAALAERRRSLTSPVPSVLDARSSFSFSSFARRSVLIAPSLPTGPGWLPRRFIEHAGSEPPSPPPIAPRLHARALAQIQSTVHAFFSNFLSTYS
eukprot:m.74707 g.74707  ORF g.74707 m.74707 type:complete len:130 (-) comp10331_c0_seq1:28-417(-)